MGDVFRPHSVASQVNALRLMGRTPDTAPLDWLTLRQWSDMQIRQEAHGRIAAEKAAKLAKICALELGRSRWREPRHGRRFLFGHTGPG